MPKDKQIFNIRETAEILIPDRLGRTCYLVGILMTLIIGAIITLLVSRLPSIVPLYFTMPWGEARLATKLSLYIIPGILLGFLVINLSLGRIAAKVSPLLPRVLAVATAVVSGMMLIALLGIVQALIL